MRMAEDNRAAIRGALLHLRRDTRLAVAFGGATAGPDALLLSELIGTATDSLRGLTVARGAGLGGKVVALGRAVTVSDYPSASAITHDYDGPVGAEGLRSIVAVPVVVRGSVRAVLYGAARNVGSLGERTVDAAVNSARALEQDLVVSDEVARRLAVLRTAAPDRPTGPEWEEVRQAHAELRLLAQRTGDPELRRELEGIGARLAGHRRPCAALRLTPRELDVLTCVAVGCTNAETGRRLHLRPETVKSYLREAMRKLDVHGRVEAVVAARRAGLLP
jgi:LuxR family transcriptional regulator, regulator of acetate metabolism